MNDIPEAAADLVQTALTARAVEPDAGEGDGHTHESACLNCGTMLIGRFATDARMSGKSKSRRNSSVANTSPFRLTLK